jgi:lysophospholipase L1-like esterase
MKKTWFTLLLLLIGICTITMFRAFHYYTPPKLQEPYKIDSQKNNDDTLRIAYIGDSWAYMHNNHKCKIAQMIENSIHRPVSVHSFGICGLTSKEIYDSLLYDAGLIQFMQERGYDYCFISAGINDTYKKMSTSYYKKSIEGIIDFLLFNHIHPIILEIPDYNIVKVYNNQKTDKILLRRLSMLINNTSLDCKQELRDALNELIREKGYKEKVSIVRYMSWNNEYEKDLKKIYINDGMHLNEAGYEVLDSIIAKTVSLRHDRFK